MKPVRNFNPILVLFEHRKIPEETTERKSISILS